MIARTRFGRTGLEVSRLGFGAAPIGFLKTDMAVVTRLLNELLDAGVNVIDTAAAYEGSEEMIAHAIGGRRQQFVLVSKCGNKVGELDAPAWSAELVARTVDRSLRRLKTEYLDVMLLHTCDLETLKRGEALGALLRAREVGKVRFVGYSGDNEAAAWAASRPQIEVIETSVNIADQNNIDLVLPVARANDVGVLAKRPLANAAWKPLRQQRGFYGDYAKPYYERLAAMNLPIEQLMPQTPAAEAWPQLALRFTLSFPEVHTAIVGTTSPEHAAANVAWAARGPLPPEVLEHVRRAFRSAEQSAGVIWSGQA